MTYEEKRALHVEISQMLADAGLNQGEIKKMVEAEIKKKVNKAFDQTIARLNSETSSGDYIGSAILQMVRAKYFNDNVFRNAVKEELNNRVIQVVLKNVEVADG